MIHRDSLSSEWIHSMGEKLGKADRVLLEKAIRALFLAEQLHIGGLQFQFKGGTSLLLQLPEPRRFSIDVDIVTTGSRDEVTRLLDIFCAEKTFSRWEEDIRVRKNDLPVEHFKLYYPSHFPGFSPENYVLLDVIYQQKLPVWTEMKPVEHPWLKTIGPPTPIPTATKEGLLGDKLTAFAPTTTGILYTKNRPVEIIKQLYDISALFDVADDLKAVSEAYELIVAQQVAFRSLSIGIYDVLADALGAAFIICDRDEKDPHFQHLKTGITNIKPHLLHRFSIDDAIIAAAKAIYLVSLLRSKNNGPPRRFTQAQEVVPWSIPTVDFNRFNRLKRTNPEAFFYIYQGILTCQ